MRDESVASRLVVAICERAMQLRGRSQAGADWSLPEASVAKLVREHGVNANLVHTWISISLYRKGRNRSLLAEAPPGSLGIFGVITS